jgi:hypothetical protein
MDKTRHVAGFVVFQIHKAAYFSIYSFKMLAGRRLLGWLQCLCSRPGMEEHPMSRFFSISYWIDRFASTPSPSPIVDWLIVDHDAREARFARRRTALPPT